MTKSYILFLTKTFYWKNIPFEVGHICIADTKECPSPGQSPSKESQVNTFYSVLNVITDTSVLNFIVSIGPVLYLCWTKKPQALVTEWISAAQRGAKAQIPHTRRLHMHKMSKPRLSWTVNIFPETQYYFFQRNSFLLGQYPSVATSTAGKNYSGFAKESPELNFRFVFLLRLVANRQLPGVGTQVIVWVVVTEYGK